MGRTSAESICDKGIMQLAVVLLCFVACAFGLQHASTPLAFDRHFSLAQPLDVLEREAAKLESEVSSANGASLEEDDDDDEVAPSFQAKFNPNNIRYGDIPLDGVLEPVCKPSDRAKGFQDYVSIVSSSTKGNPFDHQCGCVCDASNSDSPGTCFTCPVEKGGGHVRPVFNYEIGSFACEFCENPESENSEGKCVVEVNTPDSYELKCPEGSSRVTAGSVTINGATKNGIICESVCTDNTERLRDKNCIVDGICGTASVPIPGGKVARDVTEYTITHKLACALPSKDGVKQSSGVTTKYILSGGRVTDTLQADDVIEGLKCEFEYSKQETTKKTAVKPDCEEGVSKYEYSGTMYCLKERVCPKQMHFLLTCGVWREDLQAAQSARMTQELMRLNEPKTKLKKAQLDEIAATENEDTKAEMFSHYLTMPRFEYSQVMNEIVRCVVTYFKLTECYDYTNAIVSKKSEIQRDIIMKHYKNYGKVCQAHGGTPANSLTATAQFPSNMLNYASYCKSYTDAKVGITDKLKEKRINSLLSDNALQFPASGQTVVLSTSFPATSLPSTLSAPVSYAVYDCPSLNHICLHNVLSRTNFASKTAAEVGAHPIVHCKTDFERYLDSGKKKSKDGGDFHHMSFCASKKIDEWNGLKISMEPFANRNARRARE